MLMLGDAIAIPADFDADGYARQLIPLDPRFVDIFVEEGRLWYSPVNTDIAFSRSELFHAKGLMLTTNALRGIGVVTLHRVGFQTALSMQRYGANTFNAGVPSGIVKVHLREVSQDQATTIKADWATAFQDRTPAVLSEIMDFSPISWTPEDAQYLESAKLSVADIACMFNLDPTDLDATYGSSMTYANREQRAYDRLLTSIGQLLVRIEQAFRYILPRGHSAYFDRSVLLWSDASTRAFVQQTQLNSGTLTINEAREANGLPKFGAWADKSALDPAVQEAQAELKAPRTVPAETMAPDPAAQAQTKAEGNLTNA
jgi:HK97 family phage portal protein